MQLNRIIVSSSVLLSLLSSHIVLARPNTGSFDPFEPDRPSRPGDIGGGSSGGFDPWEPDRPTRPDRPHEREQVIEKSIRQYFQGESRVDLLGDYELRRQLEDKRLVSVEIIASTEQGRGQAQLVVNRLESGYPQQVQRQLSQYRFDIDQLRSVVGRDIFDLELSLKGRFYIDRVILKVQEERRVDPQPRVETVRQIINQTIQGEGGVTLDRVLNLQEHHGKLIKRLAIRARALRGMARAQLLVNNMTRAEAGLSTYTSEVSLDFYGSERLGLDIQSLRAVVKGNVVIEEVILDVESRRVNPGPIEPPRERRIERVLNTRLWDNQTLELRNVLGLNPRAEEREVESVELVIRGSEFGSRIKACQKLSVYSSITCGQVEVLRGDFAIVRLNIPWGTKAKELALQVRGMVDLEKIIVDLK